MNDVPPGPVLFLTALFIIGTVAIVFPWTMILLHPLIAPVVCMGLKAGPS
jgi:hypothetical protein